MSIHFFSDIILQPIIKKLNINLEIKNNIYIDDLASFPFHNKISDLNDGDIVIIYTDQFLHNNLVEWQGNLLETIAQFARKKSKITFLISNLFTNENKSDGLSNLFSKEDEIKSFLINQIDRIKKLDNCFFLDIKSLIDFYGFKHSYNFETGYLFQMPYVKNIIEDISKYIDDYIDFLLKEEKKVIILDCDNTLWGGIIGEDGIENIKCNKNHEGIIFYHFHHFLKEKQKEGFILCLNSKNNIDDVKNVFLKKSFPLKWDDFIIKKINWNLKSDNIKSIANELNLSENSFVFIDDNPNEIQIVKEFTDVENVIQFKNDPLSFKELKENFLFKRKKILDADLNKNEKYKQEIKRKESSLSFTNFDEYLKSIKLKFDFRLNDIDDFDRISQMTEKTNQFNFNKSAKTISDLNEFIKKNNYIFSLKLSDKFGDYGTIAVMLIEINNSHFNIINYLISCRALGKNVENVFFEHVIDYFIEKNIYLKEIFFKNTDRNKPAKIFIEKLNNYDYKIRKTE